MIPSFRPGPLLKVTGVIFVLFGLALLGGGIWLATLGGSWYYLLAGIGMLIAGVLVFKGKRSAQAFMALLLIATLIWSVIEVKFDWWQLLPRLDIWFAAAVVLTAAVGVFSPAPRAAAWLSSAARSTTPSAATMCATAKPSGKPACLPAARPRR